jgi:hypothetical protein
MHGQSLGTKSTQLSENFSEEQRLKLALVTAGTPHIKQGTQLEPS